MGLSATLSLAHLAQPGSGPSVSRLTGVPMSSFKDVPLRLNCLRPCDSQREQPDAPVQKLARLRYRGPADAPRAVNKRRCALSRASSQAFKRQRGRRERALRSSSLPSARCTDSQRPARSLCVVSLECPARRQGHLSRLAGGPGMQTCSLIVPGCRPVVAAAAPRATWGRASACLIHPRRPPSSASSLPLSC